MSNDQLEATLRAEAFRLLLARGEAVGEEELAAAAGVEASQAAAILRQLESAGRMRRDGSGRVTGSAGLSVVPDRHEIQLGAQRFWTWCAYDILGIFGALEESGRALSPSPHGRTIEVRFKRGRPVNRDAVLFLPNDDLLSCCENVYEQWCPNSNLFASEAEARSWADEHNIQGRVLTLDEASDLGTLEWADLVPEAGRSSSAE